MWLLRIREPTLFSSIVKCQTCWILPAQASQYRSTSNTIRRRWRALSTNQESHTNTNSVTSRRFNTVKVQRTLLSRNRQWIRAQRNSCLSIFPGPGSLFRAVNASFGMIMNWMYSRVSNSSAFSSASCAWQHSSWCARNLSTRGWSRGSSSSWSSRSLLAAISWWRPLQHYPPS